MGIRKDQKGFSVVEVIVILLVIALLAGIGWLVWSKQSAKDSTAQSSTSGQHEGVKIPELGVKIADPENRGLSIYYDDSGKAPCQENPNYYASNGCENYLGDTHCVDRDINKTGICKYYLYDNTTSAISASNPDGRYQCGSDLTIYEISKDKMQAATDYTADVEVGSRVVSLWAHPNYLDTCDDATSESTAAYMKGLVKYVKDNLSAL